MSKSKAVKNRYVKFAQVLCNRVIPCARAATAFKNATANIYEQIAERLPQLIASIDEESKRERTNIEFLMTDDQSTAEMSMVSKTLNETRKNVVQVANSFHEMFKVDKQIFKTISSQVDEIEDLRKSISDISLISNDIELLSYNSVFVASKAGLHGAAFTHIAKEIKVLSNNTNRIVMQLTENTEALVRDYNDFNSEMGKINNETNSRLLNIDKELSTILDKCTDGLKTIATVVFQLIDRLTQSKGLVQETMVSLQAQDLIWQLLDQVIYLSEDLQKNELPALLKRLAAEVEHTEVLAVIERHNAKGIADVEMASEILDMVVEKMITAADILKELLIRLKKELLDIKADMSSIVNFFADSQDSLQGKSSIQIFFDDSIDLLQDITAFIRSSFAKKQEIGHRNRILKANLKNIGINFNEMYDVVKQFSIIKVISKMEISREQALSNNMTSSTEMFEKLTEEIEAHVHGLGDKIELIHKNMIESLDALDTHLANQENEIARIEKVVTRSIASLQDIGASSAESVKRIGAGSSTLYDLIDDSLKGLRVIGKHVRASDSISLRYKNVLRVMLSYRKHQAGQEQIIFARPADYKRFEDLVNLAKKFSLTAENQQEAVASDQDLSADLVLF